MSNYREIPCKFYLAFLECQKGRKASHKAYCQHCKLYEPRVRMKRRNRKKGVIMHMKCKGSSEQ